MCVLSGFSLYYTNMVVMDCFQNEKDMETINKKDLSERDICTKNITLTSEEFESGKSLVAEFARKGKVMYTT